MCVWPGRLIRMRSHEARSAHEGYACPWAVVPGTGSAIPRAQHRRCLLQTAVDAIALVDGSLQVRFSQLQCEEPTERDDDDG